MEATIAEIFRHTVEEAKERVRRDAKMMPEKIRPILKCIADGLFDVAFDVNALKRKSGLNSTTWPLFRDLVGTTPWDYISQQRIETAKILVETTQAQLWVIAEEVGYDSEDVFSARFKKYTGMTPTEARQRADGCSRPILTQAGEDLGPYFAKVAASVTELEARLGRAEVLRFFRNGFAVRTARLFEALSERSRQEGRWDARRGIELAELAVLSVEGSSAALGDLSQGLFVRGLARLGNARRLANDHEGAAQELHRAERALEKVPGDQKAAVMAELFSYRGTLRLFERRFNEAHDDLHRAIGLCRSTGQEKLEAFVWLQVANLSILSGDCAAARSPLLAARQIAETSLAEDRHLRLGLASQLAYAQAESGHADEALAILPEARKLAAELGHRTAEIQADWIEATARAAKGDRQAAEALLIRAREGFMTLRDVGHTAIVSLDLAMLYEEQSRSAEVVSLAADALPALEALRLPEATSALAMLRRGIEEGQIGRKVLVKIRAILNPAAGLMASQ